MNKTAKKVILITSLSLVGVLAIGAATVGIIWRNEIGSVASIKLLTKENNEINAGPVYEMTVQGDYYFDKFLEQGGAKNDDELLQFVVDNITKGIIPIDMSAPSIGCSAFTSVTPEGDRLFGRNYDFSRTTSMIVKTNPGEGRYASISSVDLTFLGIGEGTYLDGLMANVTALASAYAPLDGINEMGVSTGIFMSYQSPGGNDSIPTNQNTDKPDITSTTMMRMILDYASSVDEAVELVEKYDFHDSAETSFHYMVADKTGKSAILEWVPETNANDATDTDGSKRILKVTYNNDDSSLDTSYFDDSVMAPGHEGDNDFQYVTNFMVEPGYYDGVDTDYINGLDRYNYIANTINPDGTNTKGEMTYQESLDLLEDVGRRTWNVHPGNNPDGITIWSALYNLTDLTMTWVGNEQFDNEDHVFEYDLKEVFNIK